jgi:hypothetical protein
MHDLECQSPPLDDRLHNCILPHCQRQEEGGVPPGASGPRFCVPEVAPGAPLKFNGGTCFTVKKLNDISPRGHI